MYSIGEMKKEEIIKRYGQAAYDMRVQQARDWKVQHPLYNKRYHAEYSELNKLTAKEWREANQEKVKAYGRGWRELNPDKVIADNQEHNRKGGKFYEHQLEYNRTGLQGERNRIRGKHNRKYYSFKQIIAPGSEIQHEWLPGTANYRGVALVEKDQHRHGIIKVIQILEGKITLFTEKEIREQVVG